MVKKRCNFADIYIDAMARSSKTSKVLKDKLQSDRAAAQNMGYDMLACERWKNEHNAQFLP